MTVSEPHFNLQRDVKVSMAVDLTIYTMDFVHMRNLETSRKPPQLLERVAQDVPRSKH